MRDATVRTQGLCGAGYPWPSSVALTNDWAKVDCPDCHRMRKPKRAGS